MPCTFPTMLCALTRHVTLTPVLSCTAQCTHVRSGSVLDGCLLPPAMGHGALPAGRSQCRFRFCWPNHTRIPFIDCSHHPSSPNTCKKGARWFVLKIPRGMTRGDTNGVGEDEVTVTSGLHAQAERTKKQRNKTEKRKPHPLEAQTKVREAGDVAQSQGRPVRGRGRALPIT